MAATSPTSELVFGEFGRARQNAGGADLAREGRLEPTLGSVRAVLPDIRVTLYTDFDLEVPGVRVVRVEPPLDPDHPRYGWRASDYFKVEGLLRSEADVAIAMDSDMLVVSDAFRTLLVLAQRFGVAMPASQRLLVSEDGGRGVDSDWRPDEDPTGGTGHVYNTSPIAFATAHTAGRRYLETFADLLRTRPARAPLTAWRAAWATGFHPYPLPFNWCVCSPKALVSRHVDGREIVLHVGNPDVLPRYRMVRRKAAWRRLRRRLWPRRRRTGR